MPRPLLVIPRADMESAPTVTHVFDFVGNGPRAVPLLVTTRAGAETRPYIGVNSTAKGVPEVKNRVSSILQEIGLLLELKGENPFKSRAYYNAARTVEMLGEAELKRLVEQDELKDVGGIGVALTEKISELVLTGSLQYYEDLKESIPEGMLEMLMVPGLGPKKIKALHDMLGISSLGELEYACKENRLLALKGFGAKTQDNIIRGIEYVRRFQGQYYYSEAKEIAGALLEELQAFSGVDRISLAGSIRRCKEIVKDIDLVASSVAPDEFTRFFSELPQVSDVIALGETKASVRLQEGINVDLRVVKPAEFPYALHHFTGSKEHNTVMRHLAKSMGMKMNEYGLFRGEKGELVNCQSEGDIFKSLGLSYIPPELRENHGEIEAAQQGILPSLVEEGDIQGIFHVHTNYSDGANTMEELLLACRDAGYSYLGISDHSQSAFYAGGLKEEELKRQQAQIAVLKEKYPDMGIFWGIESDIRADGSLDYPDELLAGFDFVIASIHSGLNMSKEKITARLLKALSHPLVTMLGHPTGRLLLGREGYPLELERILEAALENNVIMELNASPARLDLDWRHLKKAREMGLLISINPDAHNIEEIKDTDLGVAVARKGWLEKKDVFNTRSRDEVEAYLDWKNSRKSKVQSRK